MRACLETISNREETQMSQTPRKPSVSRRRFLAQSSLAGATLALGGRRMTDAAEPTPLIEGPVAPPHSLVTIAGAARERGHTYGRKFAEPIHAFLETEIYGRFVTGDNTQDRLLQYAGLCFGHVQSLSSPIAEEMEGLADGADLRVEEVALITLHEELYHKGIVPLIDHCTATAVGPPVTSDGNTYVAQSWDWMQSVYGLSQMLLWKRDDGPSVLSYSYPGLWIGAGLNSAGLALCWTSAQGGGPGIGVPSYVLLSHFLYQPTLEAVEEEARRAKQAGWFTFVMGDGEGNLLNVEGSPERIVVERSEGELSRVYFGSHEMTNTPKGDPVPRHPQCQRMMDLVRGKRGEIDLSALQSFYGDHESTICKHFGTLDVMVFNCTEREAYVTRGPGCRAEWKTFGFGET